MLKLFKGIPQGTRHTRISHTRIPRPIEAIPIQDTTPPIRWIKNSDRSTDLLGSGVDCVSYAFGIISFRTVRENGCSRTDCPCPADGPTARCEAVSPCHFRHGVRPRRSGKRRAAGRSSTRIPTAPLLRV